VKIAFAFGVAVNATVTPSSNAVVQVDPAQLIPAGTEVTVPGPVVVTVKVLGGGPASPAISAGLGNSQATKATIDNPQKR